MAFDAISHVFVVVFLNPAQIREYFSALRYVAERFNVPQLYNLKIPDWYVEHEEVDLDQFDAMMAYGNGGGGGGGGGSRRRNKKKNAPHHDEKERSTPWTALMVLEAYSEKKSYYNGKGGTPDTTKSGSELLKDIVDGKLLFGLHC